MISPVHIARLWSVGLIAVLAMACAAALYTTWGMPQMYEGLVPGWVLARPASPRLEPQDLAVETFLPRQLRDMPADQARAFNIASPLERVNPLPAPFRPEWLSPADMETATDCMAQAIYYEANSEPFAGQLAVAQVILNRLRHPRFPKTICGVIHQGNERATGCQFTFACDGSLARKPDPTGLQRARLVAQAALHGAVSAQAGQATHYHTIWIVPVWAPELRKVAIISHHVFYRPPTFYAGYALSPVMPLEPAIANADQPPPRLPVQPLPEPASPRQTTHQLAVNDKLRPAEQTLDAAILATLPPPQATGTGQEQNAPGEQTQPHFRFGGERRRQGAMPLSGK